MLCDSLPFVCSRAGSFIGLGFVTFQQEFWADYDEVMRKQNRRTGCYVDWDGFGFGSTLDIIGH